MDYDFNYKINFHPLIYKSIKLYGKLILIRALISTLNNQLYLFY